MFKDYYDEFIPYDEADLSEERIDAVEAAVLSKIFDTEKELNMDNGKRNDAVRTAKKLSKKAIIIPIAAALAIGSITVSAAALGLFDAFGSYFAKQNGSQVTEEVPQEAVSKYGKLIELDDYNVTINSILGDRFGFLINYDIEYKADKYFENGELKDEFRKGTPVHFFSANKSGGGGHFQNVSVSGNTVSFVQEFTADEGYDLLNESEYELKLRATFSDTTDLSVGLRGNLREVMTLDTSFPVTNELVLEPNADTLYNGEICTLEKIEAAALSIRFSFDSDVLGAALDHSVPVSVRTKDGRELDLTNKKQSGASKQEGYCLVIIHYDAYIDPLDITEIVFSNCVFKIENAELSDMTVGEIVLPEKPTVNTDVQDTSVSYPEQFDITEIPNITLLDETKEYDGLTVTLRGVTGDKRTARIYYDVKYTDGKYFDNGALKEIYRNISPIRFMTNSMGGGYYGPGYVNGDTVTYWFSLDVPESMKFDDQTGEYYIDVKYGKRDLELALDGEFECRFKAAAQLSVPVGEEITFPVSKNTVLLKNIELGAYSLWLDFEGDCGSGLSSFSDLDGLNATVAFITKDGTRFCPIGEIATTSGLTEYGGNEDYAPMTSYTVMFDDFFDPSDIVGIEAAWNTYDVG